MKSLALTFAVLVAFPLAYAAVGAPARSSNRGLSEALASAEEGPELRYVANAGMLVTVSGRGAS